MDISIPFQMMLPLTIFTSFLVHCGQSPLGLRNEARVHLNNVVTQLGNQMKDGMCPVRIGEEEELSIEVTGWNMTNGDLGRQKPILVKSLGCPDLNYGSAIYYI